MQNFMNNKERSVSTGLLCILILSPICIHCSDTQPADKKDRAKSISATGIALYKEKKYPQALDSFRAASKLDPANPKYLNNAGITLLKLDRPELAIGDIEKAIKIQPDAYIYYCNAGKAHLDMNNPNRAIQYFKKAIHLKPDSLDAHTQLGITYSYTNKLQKAAQHLIKANSIQKNSHTYTALSGVLIRQGKLQDAGDALSAALALNNRSPKAHFNMGRVRQLQNQPAAAIASYEQAIKINKREFQAYYNAALLYRKIGHHERARKMLEGYLATLPAQYSQQRLDAMRLLEKIEQEEHSR